MHDEDLLLLRVERLAEDLEFRARLLAMLERIGFARLVRDSMRAKRGAMHARRAHAARSMLDAGMSASEAARALEARFGVSRRTGYRIVRGC